MSYSFTADLKDNYLHVQVTGPNTPETVRRYLDDVRSACVSQGCPNVLIEEHLEGERLNVVDIFSVVNEKSSSFSPGLRLMAFVDTQAADPVNMKFAETVARNRGVTISVFPSVAEAGTWIRGKLAPP